MTVSETMSTTPPAPPGNAVLGQAGARTYDAASMPAPPSEAMAFPDPGMPHPWEMIADWLSQPAPAFVGNANAVHFYLNHTDGIGYQGFLYFKPATPPHSWFSRNRFYGVGHVYPNVPWGEKYKAEGSNGLPAPWIRVVLALRASGGIAGLTFHEASGSGALPGPEVGWAEEDVRQLLGAPPHFVTSAGPWILYLEFSTLLLST